MHTIISSALQTWAVILVLTLSVLPSFGEKQAPPENNVAIVNGKTISQKTYEQECLVLQTQLEQRGQKVDTNQMDTFKQHVLKQLIDTELLYQDSRQKGIKISDDQFAQYVAEIKKRFPSEEVFLKGLSEMGMTENDMKSKVRKSLVVQEYVTKHVLLDTATTDEEAKAFYDQRPDLFKAKETIKASHILIKSESGASALEKEAAKKQIKDIQEKINNGEDFSSLAKSHSACPSGQKGGDLGFFARGQMVKPFEEAAFALAPGEISDIVETPFGFHLIKVMEKKKGEIIAFDTAKNKIKENLTMNKNRQKISEHINTLRGAAKIETFL